MLTKKTGIGIAVGVFVIVLGAVLLVKAYSAYDVNDIVDIGKKDVFDFDAKKHFHELLNITGSSFHVKLKTPANGLQLDKDYQKELSLDWYSLDDGKHFINITNTGDSSLHVAGKLEAVPKYLEIMGPLVSMSSGVLIIGISAAFSVRKPRGF